jgi:hypothetical protein
MVRAREQEAEGTTDLGRLYQTVSLFSTDKFGDTALFNPPSRRSRSNPGIQPQQNARYTKKNIDRLSHHGIVAQIGAIFISGIQSADHEREDHNTKQGSAQR